MKKIPVIVCCLFLLNVAGCWETMALIGGGAAGGMSITRILDQQQEDIQENIALMEAQKADLEQRLVDANDAAERAEIQIMLDNTNTVLADLKDADEVIERTREGLNVNWQDPQSIIPFAGAVAATLFGIWQRRGKKKNEHALAEIVAGAQEFKRRSVPEVKNDFKAAMNDKQSAETKKLVAVIKA